MKVPILSGNVAIAKHRCWHAYDAWRRIDWIINVVIKTFALNKNGDDLSIAYNIIKPRSSASWKCNGPRFIFTRPYRRLIRLREKSKYPLTSIDDYITWRTDDGLPFDAWLRVHARLGGRIFKTCHESKTIRGTRVDWEAWTEIKFPQSGEK